MRNDQLWDQMAELDANLARLLSQRAQLAEQLGKQPISTLHDISQAKSQEMASLRLMVEMCRPVLPEKDIRAIYEQIISSCRRVTSPTRRRVVCLGPRGSFSHLAAS